jgi:hypothetical protein
VCAKEREREREREKERENRVELVQQTEIVSLQQQQQQQQTSHHHDSNEELTHRKCSKDIGGGEGGMNEEPDLGLGEFLAEKTRHEQHVVVVNPVRARV